MTSLGLGAAARLAAGKAELKGAALLLQNTLGKGVLLPSSRCRTFLLRTSSCWECRSKLPACSPVLGIRGYGTPDAFVTPTW